MEPHVTADGWLRVPYSGPDIAVIEIETPGNGWQPAYLDYENGQRIAQIRWDGPRPGAMNVRVDGVVIGWYH